MLQVQLKKRGDDERYVAKVLSIGTECDVALLAGRCWGRWGGGGTTVGLTAIAPPAPVPGVFAPRLTPWLHAHAASHPAVEDDKFWEDIVPLELSDLPALQVWAVCCH